MPEERPIIQQAGYIPCPHHHEGECFENSVIDNNDGMFPMCHEWQKTNGCPLYKNVESFARDIEKGQRVSRKSLDREVDI